MSEKLTLNQTGNDGFPIIFCGTKDGKNVEIIKFARDGNIFVYGKLIENNKEIVDGFRDFLKCMMKK